MLSQKVSQDAVLRTASRNRPARNTSHVLKPPLLISWQGSAVCMRKIVITSKEGCDRNGYK